MGRPPFRWLETDCAEDLRMSVWEATWTTKEWKRTYMIGVEDPFDDSDNCARALNTSMGRIRQAFSQAARLFDSPAGPDARGILHGLFGADVVRRLPPSLVKELEQTAGRQHQKPTGNGTGGRTGSRRKERKTHAANLPGLAQPQTEDLRRLSINSGAKSVPQPTEGT